MSHRVLLVALACLAGAVAPAQESKAENKPQGFAAERALLQRMIDRMSALPACTFTVEQEQVRSSVPGAGGAALGGGAPAAPAPAGGGAVVAVMASNVATVPSPAGMAATIASPSARGPAKSGSAVPMMTRAGHLTLGSCASASAGVDLKVFMNSAIRPGSRSLAASAAV